MHIETLRKANSSNQLLGALETLPRDLPQTYERILRQVVDKVDPDLAKKILRWVAAAKCPLSLQELREAIAIKPLREARDVGELIFDMNKAISCCGGLIFVDEENLTTHFTHKSVKEYLTSQEVHESVKHHWISLQDANMEIGIACVTYINFSLGTVARQKQVGSPFARVPHFVQKETSPFGIAAINFAAPILHQRDRSNERADRILRETAGDTELRRRNREFGKYVFRPYAERFWLEHTKSRIDPNASRYYWELWCILVNRVGRMEKCFGVTWNRDEWNNRANNVLSWIVEHDHCSLAQFLVISTPGVSEAQLWILLNGAAANDHHDLVDIYLNSRKVAPDLLDSALVEAARGGHLKMVDGLLSRHANVNTGHNDGRKALFEAILGAHVDVVERLLREGLEIDAIEPLEGRQNALQAAAMNGQLEIVEMLLENGADINAAAVDKNGRTALQAAAGEGHYTVVSFLLQRQADANAAPAKNNGRTALQAAAENGHLFIITELLLGVCFEGYEKADVNAPAGHSDGQTALQAAARNGHTSVVAYLLREHADINAPGSEVSIFGRTALQAAAENGHLDVVELLLSAKERCDINSARTEHSGQTALELAASAGHLHIVDRLLAEGADCNTIPDRWGTGRTALQAAAENGHVKIAIKLLESGAEVNAAPSEFEGFTALQAAAKNGQPELIDLLLSKRYSADVNAPAGAFGGRTAVQAAAEGGHLKVMLRLLEEGAKINDPPTPNSGKTALQAAAGGGHLKVVQDLLLKGADVNEPNASHAGRTAIQAAAEGGHQSVVKELLMAGAQVNTRLQDAGGTALRLAAEGGFLETVRILLDQGASDVAEANRGPIGGQSALMAALVGEHRDVVKCLQDAGFTEARYY